MIYTRMGSPVVLLWRHGEQRLSGFDSPVELLAFRYSDDSPAIHRFIGAHALRADGGSQEIDAAIQQLPTKRISKSGLRFADANLA